MLPLIQTGGGGAAPPDQFYPETYGAVGNGVHDDTTAIQAAIAACAANGGGWVVLSAKTYLISAALTITSSNVNITGQGMYNTTILQSSASADVIQLTGTSYTVPIYGIQLEDFAINRSLQPTGTASGVKYTYTVVTHTRRLNVWDCTYAFNIAAAITDCGHVDHDQCLVNYSLGAVSGSAGFYLGGRVTSTRIVDCLITGGTYGMYVAAVTADLFCEGFETAACGYAVYFTAAGGDVSFLRCVHDSITNQAYTFTGDNTGIAVIGGYVDAGSPMVRLNSCSGVLFQGVQFLCTTAGTIIEAEISGTSEGNSFQGCIFDGYTSSTKGILITGTGCSSNVISGNIFNGPMAAAISLASSATYNTIQGNSIWGSSGSVITTGISADSTTSYNGGVNSINPAFVTTPVSNSGSNNSFSVISTTWDSIGSAQGNLTLNNGAYSTTFNQSDAAAWLWANTTSATDVVAPTFLAAAAAHSNGAPLASISIAIGDTVVVMYNSDATGAPSDNGSSGGNTYTLVDSDSAGLGYAFTYICLSATKTATAVTIPSGTQGSVSVSTWSGVSAAGAHHHSNSTGLSVSDAVTTTAVNSIVVASLMAQQTVTVTSGTSVASTGSAYLGQNVCTTLAPASSTVVTTSGTAAAGNTFWTAMSLELQGVSGTVTNQSSPLLSLAGEYWNGSASSTDSWTLQDVLGMGSNPTSILNISHSGTSGAASVKVPNIIVTGGQVVSVNTQTGASYTPLVSDYAVIFTYAGAVAVTLNSSLATGTVFRCKNETGVGNSVTYTPSSGNIDGAPTLVQSINNQSVDLVFDGTNWNIF